MEASHLPMEDTAMFAHYVAVANWAWKLATNWKAFARDTVGIQLVKAADSVGANLVEGDGRYTTADALRFFIIARASARETRYWIERSVERDLVARADANEFIDRIHNATRMLNGVIRHRRNRASKVVREQKSEYDAYEDPFHCDLDDDEEIVAIERAQNLTRSWDGPNT